MNMRTDDELNNLLHEKVMQECWHEWEVKLASYICSKCQARVNKMDSESFNPDYIHDPAAYWRLLQKVKGHKDWYKFITVTFSRGLGQEGVGVVYI